MTHSLHRRGSEEDLKKDFVVLAMSAQGFNNEGRDKKMQDITKAMLRHNPLNYGSALGSILNSSREQILDHIETKDPVICHAVYNNEDDLISLLKDLKEEDHGMSVVVSGLFDHVHECCHKVGIEPHTVNNSLGIFGRTDKLPDERVLEAATMCGHSMISFNLIKKMVGNIRAGNTTAKEAAKELGKNCHCGIFNTERAETILSSLAFK